MKHHKIKAGDIDLLAGCPPCQAFSSMRRLNGHRQVRDRKNKDLLFDFLRFVRQLRPKVILMENVPHLGKDRRFLMMQRLFNKLGYLGKPEIFNAADFGVPQRRRRLIYIASRVGSIEYARAFQRNGQLTVRNAIGHLRPPGNTGDPLHDFPESHNARITHLIAKVPKDGGSRSSLGKRLQLPCHRKCDGFKDVYGRMWWDKVAPTITGSSFNPSKGRFLHPSQDRAITLREAAILQSFPEGYSFSLRRGKCAAAQMIGNAFPPKLVRAHASNILNRLCSGPTTVQAGRSLN